MFHINQETGRVGACRAKSQCPFGGGENHFSTKEEATKELERREAMNHKLTESFNKKRARVESPASVKKKHQELEAAHDKLVDRVQELKQKTAKDKKQEDQKVQELDAWALKKAETEEQAAAQKLAEHYREHRDVLDAHEEEAKNAEEVRKKYSTPIPPKKKASNPGGVFSPIPTASSCGSSTPPLSSCGAPAVPRSSRVASCSSPSPLRSC